MKLFIITEDELENGNDAIKTFNHDYWRSVNSLETRPLTLCQDCEKWKTGDCKKAKIGEMQLPVASGVWQVQQTFTPTDPDDFCKDGEPKEIV